MPPKNNPHNTYTYNTYNNISKYQRMIIQNNLKIAMNRKEIEESIRKLEESQKKFNKRMRNLKKVQFYFNYFMVFLVSASLTQDILIPAKDFYFNLSVILMNSLLLIFWIYSTLRQRNTLTDIRKEENEEIVKELMKDNQNMNGSI